MALTEPQIHRYSRQILLRDVGGVGQQKLLATEVQLAGGGRALLTAAAYLAGGGCVITASAPDARAPVRDPADTLPVRTGDDAGFLLAAGEEAPLAEAAARMNPDAGPRPTQQRILLCAAPGRPQATPSVTVGADARRAAILVASAESCPMCLALNAPALAPPSGALGVAAGALAATLVQRLALGLEPHGALQLLLLSNDGTQERGRIQRCDRCQ